MAFDIIKEKRVSPWWFPQFNNVEDYNKSAEPNGFVKLTEEEFELLRGVINDMS